MGSVTYKCRMVTYTSKLLWLVVSLSIIKHLLFKVINKGNICNTVFKPLNNFITDFTMYFLVSKFKPYICTLSGSYYMSVPICWHFTRSCISLNVNDVCTLNTVKVDVVYLFIF